MSNDVLADIAKGRHAYDAMPGIEPDGGAADYRVMVRIAAALERIADALEENTEQGD